MTMPVSRQSQRAWVALCGMALALAACSGGEFKLPSFGSADPYKQDPNVFPASYRQEVLVFLRAQLEDPTNVRGAFIAEPVLKPFGAESRYAACVRYNARSDGQYIGSKDRLAVFYSGQLNQLINATPEQCGTAAYQPFPELESLKRPGTS